MTKLHVIDGQMGDQFFDFEDDVIFLGRASNNDVQISDYSISRSHLKIIRKGAKYLIEDQGSRNGTWVDGDLLEPGKELEVREGIPIVVGNTLICLGDKAPQDNMLTLYAVSVCSPKGKDRENLIYKDKRFTSRRSLELIYEVSTVLMQSSNIEDVCKKIMDCLFSYLKRIDSGAILWIDSETGELREIVSRARNNQESIKISHSRTTVNRVIREGKAVVISDISCEREEDFSRTIEKMLIKSVMCVPLIIKSEIRGVFYVHSENVRNGFRRDDLFLLTGLSTPAALAIENGLLHSKREQVEEKLRKAHHELERRIQERTAELIKTNEDLRREIRERKQAEEKREEMEAQLLQAQKMEAVGTLAGGIAHDFNNLLQAVQGYAELLLMRKKEGERGWRELEEITYAAKRGAELTQQLLTFSRKVESEKRPLDLNKEVKELRELLERTIPKMIEVKLQLSDDLQAINADAVQLKQVLMNLAVNAKDAMPGGGTLLIETENVILDQEFCRKYAEVKPGDYVQLTVSDTGHG
ncbi:MAG: FHA domain-containing protein, partial [Promethearchaeota archaeon]